MNDSTLDSPVIQIPLTQGYTAIVDPEDADLLAYNWYTYIDKTTCYALKHSAGAPKTLRMHRLIMERILGRTLLKNEMVDHRNLDGLDNTRNNLRLATNAQNACNRTKQRNNTSGYKGVMKIKGRDRWIAVIRFNQKRITLGSFSAPELAAKAYNEAAVKYFGEFAWLNPISE